MNKKNKTHKIKKSIKKFKKSIKRSKTKIKNKLLIKERLKKKYKIKDIPIEKKENKGTAESSGFIDYHYQRLDNITIFFSKIKKDNDVYIDDKMTIELNMKTKKIDVVYSNIDYFKKALIDNINKDFIIITTNIQLITFSHANIILVDNNKKNIEYFEPHGFKNADSTLDGVVGAYKNKSKILQNFMKKILPTYKFINISELFKKEGLQMKYDSRNGYCVTWAILYIHYRLLNINIRLDILIQYIYYFVNKNILLRYAKYIEKILKI